MYVVVFSYCARLADLLGRSRFEFVLFSNTCLQGSLKNFDLVFVFKDYNRMPLRIAAIPRQVCCHRDLMCCI